MIQLRKLSEEGRDSSSPKSVILSSLSSMELKGSSAFPSVQREPPLENPFGEVFPDPLCKLNLKETSEFVKAFPMTSKNSSVVQRRLEAPPTPGRPVFSFSAGYLSRKSVTSKWDDAEKWLISSSCHESPAHVEKHSDTSKISRPNDVLRVTEEKLTSFQGPVVTLDPNITFPGVASGVLLRDKFTDNAEPVYPNFQFSNPTKEDFLFKDSYHKPLKDSTPEIATEVQHRDIGTEMTPLGSSTTSRCHTPIKSSSPARHNTPANRSGPLVNSNASFDISQLMDCHFAKLELNEQYESMVSNWSSREEEEAEVSKSLRHFDMNCGRKSITESRDAGVFLWEDEERTQSCLRYQREEAKIQAWVNLQSAKAEAQSRKLEVKIQKMRSNLEEKLMKRMAIVHGRAEELRAAAQLQHSQQILRASEQAQKMISHHMHISCGCFPCNNHL